MRYLNVKLSIKTVAIAWLFFAGYSSAGDRIQGDAGEGDLTTFSFPVDKHIMSSWGDYFFVGARVDATGTNDYALSFLEKSKTEFLPLTPEKVILDGQENAENPLFDNTIKDIVFAEITYPVIVPGIQKTTTPSLYVLSSFLNPKKISLVSATDIQDASVAPGATTGIEGISAAGNCIFAAVKPKGGASFGQDGSGIALLLYGTKKVETDKLDDKGKKIIKVMNIVEQKNTAALNTSSSVVQFGGDLDSLSYSDMHWDPVLNVLYIALKVESGSGGARAIVVGMFDQNNNLVLKNIAPDAVFAANNEVVGTGESDKVVNIYKIKTMQTTTGLNYLIVLGGNEDADDKGFVSAFPLVHDTSTVRDGNKIQTIQGASHAMLAKFDSDPVNNFVSDNNELFFFKERFYKVPAAQNADILKLNDNKAEVGKRVAPGEVVDIMVKGDTVFVAVQELFEKDKIIKRIYYSRAMFDQKGRINDWQQWRPVKASEGSIFGFDIKSSNATFVTIESDTSSDAADAKS
ncbi:hypothetical protein KAH94_05445, partial [bacterium]|nr:hypothetical protein [bacterium]